ncbi:MAG: tyrosine-protein phosphatase [Ilumatobacter sp.]|jgi:hypothetical protein|uniref:protein-tyrosine phosphatase family protein n=1 Tax=Ilumatobacter sp. TaxID=1967498 RepID=UPI00391BA5A3
MSWPIGRQLDGGLDRITTPDGASDLWLCGKHVVAPDPEAVRADLGPSTYVVSLNEERDLERFPGYVDWLRTSRHARWFPMPDFHAPRLADALPILQEISGLLHAGDPVLMHCSAGIGRAGTMAVGTLMMLGVPMPEALRQVASERRGAGPEAGPQRELIISLAEHLA